MYAAYGGVFIVLSVLWGWKIDKTVPDHDDITLTTPTALLQLWLIGRSVGIGFASQPASAIALSDVPPAELARGSSFYNVMRQVASAFATSFLATYVKDQAGPHFAHLAEQTTPSSPLYAYVRDAIGLAVMQGR